MTPVPRIDRRVSIAPMMDWTDRYYRNFMRTMTRRTLLFTEMVTTGAILHGDRERHLGFNAHEHPVALQLGGSDPQALAECASIAQDYGYDEVNLNVGCPSDRVQSGKFGACLMAEPQLVAECVAAMRDRVSIPVTVKTRIGVDEQDSWAFLHRFVSTVHAAGCEVFTIHARKAWLKGLSPKENREIPPLRHDVAARVKAEFPELEVHLNGGIKSLADMREHLDIFDGVMIGREAYSNPFLFASIDADIFGEPNPVDSRFAAVDAYRDFMQAELDAGTPLKRMTRHMLGLFQGVPGARLWRRTLSVEGVKRGAGMEVIDRALDSVREASEQQVA